MPEELQACFVTLPPERTHYFNGFSISISAGDIVLLLTRNGIPLLNLNTTFTVAKTFAEALKTTMDTLEKHAPHPIMTVEEVKTVIGKINADTKTN